MFPKFARRYLSRALEMIVSNKTTVRSNKDENSTKVFVTPFRPSKFYSRYKVEFNSRRQLSWHEIRVHARTGLQIMPIKMKRIKDLQITHS